MSNYPLSIYIDGDPDWSKPRIALMICGLLAVIFGIRGVTVLDSPPQAGFFGVMIVLILGFGVYVYHKYRHSRIEVGEHELEVAVSLFNRRRISWQEIVNVEQQPNQLKLELKNGEMVRVDLTYFTPEALDRISEEIRQSVYPQASE